MGSRESTSIGAIKIAAADHYRRTGQKYSFVQALRAAMARGLVVPPYEVAGEDALPLDRYWRFIEGIPVKVSPKAKGVKEATAPAYYGNFYITEETMFFSDEAVRSYIHIPYIYDGMHTHDHFEINYVYHGGCVLQLGNKTHHLDEGAFFVLAPDSPHCVFCEGDSLLISIMIRKTMFDTFFASYLNSNDVLARFFYDSMFTASHRGCIMLSIRQPQTMHKYMQSLMMAYYRNDYYHNINTVCILSLIFSHIAQHNDHASCAVHYDFSSENLDFAVLIQYIRQHYNTVTLAVLSDHFHYSESFLSRLIKEKTGRNFSSMVKKQKMHHAKVLLENSRLSVQEISAAVGYASPNHFNRTFKSFYGATPLAFRKQAERDDIAT